MLRASGIPAQSHRHKPADTIRLGSIGIYGKSDMLNMYLICFLLPSASFFWLLLSFFGFRFLFLASAFFFWLLLSFFGFCFLFLASGSVLYILERFLNTCWEKLCLGILCLDFFYCFCNSGCLLLFGKFILEVDMNSWWSGTFLSIFLFMYIFTSYYLFYWFILVFYALFAQNYFAANILYK